MFQSEVKHPQRRSSLFPSLSRFVSSLYTLWCVRYSDRLHATRSKPTIRILFTNSNSVTSKPAGTRYNHAVVEGRSFGSHDRNKAPHDKEGGGRGVPLSSCDFPLREFGPTKIRLGLAKPRRNDVQMVVYV